MGGNVTCSSQLGVGTEFSIKLNTKCKKKSNTTFNVDNFGSLIDEKVIIYKKASDKDL